jgi:hypothetical protein
MTDPIDYENLTDDEIALMETPTAPDATPTPDPEDEKPEVGAESDLERSEKSEIDDTPVVLEEPKKDTAETEVASAEAAPEEVSKTPESVEPVTTKETPTNSGDTPQTPGPEVSSSPLPETGTGDSDAPGQENKIDYKASYEKIMAPFRANRKEVQVRDPDEAIRLMQLGANYTQRMQQLSPNIKLMRMLQNNNLLDENKINRLIDLDQRKPEAIKSLLHESKIDPLDLDMEDAQNYQPSDHTISDQAHEFQTVLDDIVSTQQGQETAALINSAWDQKSKEALFQEPQLLKIIDDQRASGIYDTISSEVDRQKMLGNLVNVPFIQAYRQVGDILESQGKLAPASQPGSTPAPAVVTPNAPTPIETRPARSAQPAATAAQARAASSTPSQQPAKKAFDPYSMTDEQIEAMSRPPR